MVVHLILMARSGLAVYPTSASVSLLSPGVATFSVALFGSELSSWNVTSSLPSWLSLACGPGTCHVLSVLQVLMFTLCADVIGGPVALNGSHIPLVINTSAAAFTSACLSTTVVFGAGANTVNLPVSACANYGSLVFSAYSFYMTMQPNLTSYTAFECVT